MSDTHDVRPPDHGGDDAALLHRLFDLTCGKHGDRSELERIDSTVYTRLMETYGASEPPTLPRSDPARA